MTLSRAFPPGLRRLFAPTAPISPVNDLLIKCLYLAIWGAVGLFFPFITIYYRSIGLAGTQIGLIGMVGALSAAVGSTTWGMINDRLGKITWVYSMVCLGGIVMSQVVVRLHDFWLLLPAVAAFSFFNSGLIPLLDSAVLRILGPYRQSYGAYRLWGSLGFVLTCSVSGYLLERSGLSLIFITYPAALLVFWLATRWLPTIAPGRGANLFSGLREMVRNPRWVLFAASIFILWLAGMAGLTFLSIVLKEMGATERIIGLNSTIAALAEIPLLVGSSWALRKFGPSRLLVVAMAAYCVRLVLYSFMPSVTWALWISLFQSLSYCPFLVGSVAYANEQAPEHLKSTSQGLLATIMNLANLFGSPVGGFLFDHTGRMTMYLVLAGLAFLSLLLFVGGQAGFGSRERRELRNEEVS